MKEILVTGGAGFIGSYFVDKCLQNEIIVHNYDALKKGSMLEHGPNKKHPLYHFKQIDVSNDNYEIPQVDTIVHFAAETHVDRSITDPYSFVQANILGTYNLLRKTKPGTRFHLVSTDEVYGDVVLNLNPSTETDNIVSSSPYSASKSASEQLVLAWGRTFNLDYTITRGCNTIGARQDKEKLLPKFIFNAQNNISLPVYDKGIATRQYIYVTDHVDAIYKVVTESKTGEIYNVCSDFSCSINDVVKFLKEHYPNVVTTDNESRPGHDMKYNMSNLKIIQNLNWQPVYKNENVLIKAYNDIII